MKKLLLLIGTRPEAIKLAPLAKALMADGAFLVHVCLTGQHQQLALEPTSFFGLRADYSLGLMEDCHGDLLCLTQKILAKITEIMEGFKPDAVIVQGDTVTAFAGSLAAFYARCKIAHVEAGLRTFDKENPFPEEFFRASIGKMADFHFAPTDLAVKHLAQEGVPAGRIFLTGNTIVDAMKLAGELAGELDPVPLPPGKKLLLITVHRRENRAALKALWEAVVILAQHQEWHFVFPMHPMTRELLRPELAAQCLDNVALMEPLPYGVFLKMLAMADLVLTDSGGVQEEAAILNKKMVVLRKTTERPEAVEAGLATVAGMDSRELVEICENLIEAPVPAGKNSALNALFGDGNASARIVEILKQLL